MSVEVQLIAVDGAAISAKVKEACYNFLSYNNIYKKFASVYAEDVRRMPWETTLDARLASAEFLRSVYGIQMREWAQPYPTDFKADNLTTVAREMRPIERIRTLDWFKYQKDEDSSLRDLRQEAFEIASLKFPQFFGDDIVTPNKDYWGGRYVSFDVSTKMHSAKMYNILRLTRAFRYLSEGRAKLIIKHPELAMIILSSYAKGCWAETGDEAVFYSQDIHEDFDYYCNPRWMNADYDDESLWFINSGKVYKGDALHTYLSNAYAHDVESYEDDCVPLDDLLQCNGYDSESIDLARG